MTFIYSQKILFKHCDPAGIVFYPRYFEMINDVVEEFFDSELDCSFPQILERNGVPTVQIKAVFSAPSRHGDILAISLNCSRLGQSSLDLEFEATCNQEKRFQMHSTLVFVDSSGKPTLWPVDLRHALQSHLPGEQ